jgi:hypothetical protein
MFASVPLFCCIFFDGTLGTLKNGYFPPLPSSPLGNPSRRYRSAGVLGPGAVVGQAVASFGQPSALLGCEAGNRRVGRGCISSVASVPAGRTVSKLRSATTVS